MHLLFWPSLKRKYKDGLKILIPSLSTWKAFCLTLSWTWTRMPGIPQWKRRWMSSTSWPLIQTKLPMSYFRKWPPSFWILRQSRLLPPLVLEVHASFLTFHLYLNEGTCFCYCSCKCSLETWLAFSHNRLILIKLSSINQSQQPLWPHGNLQCGLPFWKTSDII